MSAVVVDLAPYRERRRRPPRPTVAQAARTYPEAMFGLVVTQGASGSWGRVAHRAYVRTAEWATTPCGNGGPARPAPPDTLVCLRCFPWWHA